VEHGEFGNWLEEKKAKKDYYACGAQLRQDTSAVNDYGAVGLKFLYCHFTQWDKQYVSMVVKGENNGHFGHSLKWQ